MAFEYKQLLQSSVSSLTSSEDQFGYSVCIGDYYAFVSAPYLDDTNSDVGSIFIFERENDGTWSFSQQIKGAEEDSKLGYSLNFTDNILSIGVPGKTSGGHSNAGTVLIYSLSTGFSLSGEIESSYEQDDAEFGKSVCSSGDYIIIGAPGTSSSKGAAYIYNSDLSFDISLLRYGDGDTVVTGSNGDYFGYSVSINGSYAAVGAVGESSGTGSVYIYEFDRASQQWEFSQILTASDAEENDYFGNALSINGDYILIGAKNKNSSDDDPYYGASYLFMRTDNGWVELKKFIPSLSYVENNPFYYGSSVSISKDFAVIGAPGGNFVDIYSKKRDWRFVKRILNEVDSEDNFGQSVFVSGKNLIIGNSDSNDAEEPSGGEDVGGAYIYENYISKVRLAQEFDVDSEYVPSKASIYLNRIGKNSRNYFLLDYNNKNVIDATNFSSIDWGDNKIIFDDRIDGFTGNGYMILAPEEELIVYGEEYDSLSVINYPIMTNRSVKYNLWLRGFSNESSTFNVEILIDGNIVKEIDESFSEVSSSEWEWFSTYIVLPDTRQHTLGIKIKEKGCAIDKIYLDESDVSPYFEGPDYDDAPFLTTHVKLHSATGYSYPLTPLFIYDYKTSIEELIKDDWYNFDINIRDERMGYTTASDFTDNYFLVLTTTGINESNFIIWKMIDNDEYSSFNSAIRF